MQGIPDRARDSHIGALGSRNPPMSAVERRRENVDLCKPRNYGLPWMDDARARVAMAFQDGKLIAELDATFERTQGAIHAKLVRQGLVEPEFQLTTSTGHAGARTL